jgi:hypothetical protein
MHAKPLRHAWIRRAPTKKVRALSRVNNRGRSLIEITCVTYVSVVSRRDFLSVGPDSLMVWVLALS